MTSPAHPKDANTVGWRVVPVEATEEMRAAWLENTRVGAGESLADADWRGMLAAAPAPDFDALAVELFDRAPTKTVAGLAAAMQAYFEGE